MEELLKNPVFLWFIAGVVCAMLEFAIPGLVIIFFAVGAWTAALMIWLFDISLIWQIIFFIAGTVISLLLLRRRFVGKREVTEADDEFIGKTAVAAEKIVKGGFGKVSYKGALWTAYTEGETAIEKDDLVRITGHVSTQLIIEPIKQ